MDDKTVQNILEKIENSKTEIKSSIQASESNILLELENLKFKIRTLERENVSLRDKVDRLERKSNENNIVVFGWTEPNDDITSDFICNELNNLLGVEIGRSDINNFYCLGKKSNRPVKIEFVSYLKKIGVIRHCKKLRGSGIAIRDDLTEQQRNEYRVLRGYLIEQREKGETCHIRGNKLVVNNKEYTLHDLEEARKHPTVRRTNSNPATPTQSLIHNPEEVRTQAQPPENIEEISVLDRLQSTPVAENTARKIVKPERVTRLRLNVQRKDLK